jgi:hypothetical protein
MMNRKSNLFITGRKLGLSVGEVRSVLRELGYAPTHAEAALQSGLELMAVREFMHENGIKMVLAIPRRVRSGGDVSASHAVIALKMLRAMAAERVVE